MKALFSLNKYFWRYKWHLLGGVVFVFASNYFRILQPQMIRKAMDLVHEKIRAAPNGSGSLSPEVATSLGSTVLYFGSVVLLLALLMGVFMFLMRQTIVVMSRLVEYDLRKDIFRHYEDLDLAFYKRNNTGDLMARITEDVSKVRMYLGPAILYGINLLSLFALTLGAMFSVSVQLSLYSLMLLPILSVVIYYVSDRIQRNSSVIAKQLAHLNSIAQESFSGIRVVKSYVQETALTAHFEEESEIFRKKSMSLARVDAIFAPFMVLMIGASVIITVYVGGLQVAAGTLTMGNIAEFVLYVSMLTWPVTSLGWVASMIQQAAASQKRINEFLEQKPSISNFVTKNNILKKIKGEIIFENVTFIYPDTGIVALKNVNFTLAAGEKMAIIGRTGAGKTSVADLLARLYDPTEGRILLDGQDLKKWDLSHLRQQIGYVPQDVFLFSDTIEANIRFGKNNASRQEVEQFAHYSAVYQDIMTLPKGFDTIIGERGVTLSGGQKQRVSIARALIKQPDIVLLDDCLSAIDSDTEQQIVGYLNTALAEKTTILITHRLYGQMNFDKILVLTDGEVEAFGSHHQLMEQNGYYADLYASQNV